MQQKKNTSNMENANTTISMITLNVSSLTTIIKVWKWSEWIKKKKRPVICLYVFYEKTILNIKAHIHRQVRSKGRE